ncbi:hypothetical protein HaLaN_20654 [Haematococcus lacustris]|uniref:Uncharacterized protein n=1 Tax=Haematococcus lacustris TaxID=44745 RepID=A0A699ZM26_HAELA|nr:hypothetical protein HaLaN_20654 [Haematococcus lacustris]
METPEAVFGTRQAVSSCFKAISSQEPSSVVEDVELDVALLLMKDEAFALAAELRRQAAMAPHFQSQPTAGQAPVAIWPHNSSCMVWVPQQGREVQGPERPWLELDQPAAAPAP